jgi:hypothetical protein
LYCGVESKWKNCHIILFLDSLFPKNGDIIYGSSAWEDGRHEDEEEDVGGC